MLRYLIIFLSSVFSLFAQSGVTILGSDTYFEFMDSTEIFLNYDEINKCLGNEFYEYGIASL